MDYNEKTIVVMCSILNLDKRIYEDILKYSRSLPDNMKEIIKTQIKIIEAAKSLAPSIEKMNE